MAKKSVTQQLASLTYRDMVDFSDILSEQLSVSGYPDIDASVIADVLANLPARNEQTDNTNDMLADVFRRKRVIAVTPLKEGGFKMSCASYEGAVVFDKDIREGMSQLLDTLTVLNGLQ